MYKYLLTGCKLYIVPISIMEQEQIHTLRFTAIVNYQLFPLPSFTVNYNCFAHISLYFCSCFPRRWRWSSQRPSTMAVDTAVAVIVVVTTEVTVEVTVEAIADATVEVIVVMEAMAATEAMATEAMETEDSVTEAMAALATEATATEAMAMEAMETEATETEATATEATVTKGKQFL